MTTLTRITDGDPWDSGATDAATLLGEYADAIETSVGPIDTPERHGAVGNGTTDDAVAVQAAIDSGAKFVVLGPKTYGCKSTIHHKDGVTIFGLGEDVSELKAIGTFTGSILLDSDSGSGVQHANVMFVHLEGNSLVSTTYSSTSPAGQPGHNHADFVQITGSTGFAVELGGATSPVGYECHISYYGIGTSASGIRMTGTDCHIGPQGNMGSITGVGIQLDGGGANVHGNHIVTSGSSAHAMVITAGSWNIVTGNYFDASGSQGVTQVLIQPTTGRTSTDSILVGNVFNAQFLTGDGTIYAITLDATNGQVDNWAIESNTGRAKHLGNWAGIVTTVGSPSNWSFDRNRFTYCKTFGSLAPSLGRNEIYDDASNKISRPRVGKTALTYGTTITPDASIGDELVITVTNTTAFTIATPTNPVDGMDMTIVIINSSGSTMGAVTWSSAYRFDSATAPTSPANGKERYVRLRYSNTDSKWHERGRSTGDL